MYPDPVTGPMGKLANLSDIRNTEIGYMVHRV